MIFLFLFGSFRWVGVFGEDDPNEIVKLSEELLKNIDIFQALFKTSPTQGVLKGSYGDIRCCSNIMSATNNINFRVYISFLFA